MQYQQQENLQKVLEDNTVKKTEIKIGLRNLANLEIVSGLKKGDTILKYGHDIGKVVASIKKGEHVHVHNVKTKKW